MDKLYTDVRFLVADLSPGFGVISDLAEYDFSLPEVAPYKKITNYLLTNGLGEVVQVIRGDSLLYDQAERHSLQEFGLRPIFAKTNREADEKLTANAQRKRIRFYTNNVAIRYASQDKVGTGSLRDISTGGCSVEMATLPVAVGDTFHLEIAPNRTDSTFSAKALIIRVQNDSFSAKFDELDQSQKSEMWKLLIAHHQS
nr:PilZ domain-containing protein [uncultured Desulfobulbus sp.]